MLCANISFAQQLDERFGDADGRFKQSVNGMAVFAELLKQHGCDVKMFRTFSEQVDDVDLVVWVADRLDAPNSAELALITERNANNRWSQLLFIGRDYDASIAYWEKVIDQLPKKKRSDAEKLLDHKKSEWNKFRSSSQFISNRFFRYRVEDRWEAVTELSGLLSRGIDESKTDLVLTGRVINLPKFDVEVLLRANGEPFVFVLTAKDDSLIGLEIIVVANGSLLLNLPLVNHENRKIADNLIDLLDPQRVAMLCTGSNDISQTENQDPIKPNVWEWMAVPPFNWIIPHFILFGLLYLFCYFPIFGRPAKLPPTQVSKFNMHLEAVGELMKQSGDKQFARNAIEHYRQISGHHSKS